MKSKLHIIVLFICVSIGSYAQQSIPVTQVPSGVKATLESYYPGAPNVIWQQDGAYFIPAFKVSQVTTKLLIDAKGALVQTSVQTPPSTLSPSVTSYISTHYPGQSVTDAEKLTMFNKSTRYEVVIAGKDLIFDANGAFLKFGSGLLKQ
jgi:hypothetical protein